MTEAETGEMHSADGGMGHKLNNVGNYLELKEKGQGGPMDSPL